VVLLESCLTDTPVLVGVFRPVILAPLGLLAGLPTQQVELILMHELAHIRRHDYLVNLAQSLIEGLLFYHPAVWWVSRLVRTEREFCCDDMVVELSGDARGYAEALGTLEQRRWAASDAALAANGGSLMIRIRRLLRKERPTISATPIVGLLLLLGSAVFAAWQPSTPPPPLPPPPEVVIVPVPPPQPKPHVKLIAQAQATPRPATPPAPPAPVPTPPPAAPPVEPKVYIIGVQDELRIEVFREPELTRNVTVRADGKITFPLLNEVQAEGLTAERLQTQLTERLTGPITAPIVAVTVVSMKYDIAGMVNQPGTYPLLRPVKIFDAINAAGGFREFANTKNIIIVRGDERLTFNYSEFLKGENTGQNIYLESGDTIIVK